MASLSHDNTLENNLYEFHDLLPKQGDVEFSDQYVDKIRRAWGTYIAPQIRDRMFNSDRPR